MAEIDADDLAERTEMGRRGKIENRKQWFGLNKPPFGYKKVGNGRDTQVAIDEETAPIVRNIYEWFVNGDGSGKPYTMRDVIKRLIADRIPTPTDRQPDRAKPKLRAFAQATFFADCVHLV
jgi:hypothetical protein